eukprot:6213536-Pyramimonas_sp.AAC.1
MQFDAGHRVFLLLTPEGVCAFVHQQHQHQQHRRVSKEGEHNGPEAEVVRAPAGAKTAKPSKEQPAKPPKAEAPKKAKLDKRGRGKCDVSGGLKGTGSHSL